MIILIYWAIGFISSIIVAYSLLLLLRYFNSKLFKIADHSIKKSEPEFELQGVIVESPKPKPAEIIEPEPEVIDEVFNFQSLPPELRLMVYHRMELISKLQLKSIVPFSERQFIDETCRNIESWNVVTNGILEPLTFTYEKNGLPHKETYSGDGYLEVLRNIKYFCYRKHLKRLYKVYIYKDEGEKICLYDYDDKPVLRIYTHDDGKAFRFLKPIPYTSIMSHSSMVPEFFDLPRTKSATEVHIKGECTISKDQLYDLKATKIYLNIPSFGGLELKEYIQKILLNYDNQPIDRFRVRTTENNTTIFVTEMLKLDSQNHTNSEIFRNVVEERRILNCFAGDNEECKAMFCLIRNGRTITVHVSKSEIIANIKDEL